MSFARAFFTDLRRRVFSPSFIVMTLIAALSYFISAAEELKFVWNSKSCDILYLHMIAFDLGFLSTLAVLCCTALNCTAFLNDYESSFYRGCILRSGKHRYTAAKFLSCVVTGGLILALGLIIFVLILRLRFPLANPNGGIVDSAQHSKSLMGELITEGHYVGYFAVLALLSFLYGGMWSAVGLCVSAFIPDKYAASFSPFIILKFSELFLTGNFYFDNILSGYFDFGGIAQDLLFAIAYLGTITVVFGVIFCIKAERRCSQ